MQKSRDGYGKNWMHFITNWTLSFEVSGFRMKTHLLHRLFKILITYYNSELLAIYYAPFKTTSSTFNPFWHNLIFLIHLLICVELNDPQMEKNYKWTLKKVETWHGIIISTTQHVLKSWESSGKNWMHFVYKLDNLFEVSGFRMKTHLLHRQFKFF